MFQRPVPKYVARIPTRYANLALTSGFRAWQKWCREPACVILGFRLSDAAIGQTASWADRNQA